MIEDKLSHDERIRLEAISQANFTLGGTSGRVVDSAKVLDVAAQYERFVKGGTDQ